MLASQDTITINTPGTYIVSNTTLLGNNKSIIGGVPGVIIKKLVAFSHIFANSLASSNGTTKNTNITISNIAFDENNLGSQSGAVRLTANGILYFYLMDGLTISNVSIINGDNALFGVHLENVINANITNYFYNGEKDAFHLGAGCDTITVDGFDISSKDDAFAIVVDDYPHVQSASQDTKNITIQNGISRPYTGQLGYFLRLVTGSWLTWSSGNSYDIGHICVNSGNIYKKYNASSMVASVAPTHTSGMITGADGIQWNWIGAGVNTTSNISNVTLHNITLSDGRKISRIDDEDTYNHCVYPGTENTSIVDNLSFPFSLASGIWQSSGLVGTVNFDQLP